MISRVALTTALSLSGSSSDGMLEGDSCLDWSTSGEGSAMVGHHDRTGGGDNPTSWNSAHGSRGCGLADLQGTGGDGLFFLLRDRLTGHFCE